MSETIGIEHHGQSVSAMMERVDPDFDRGAKECGVGWTHGESGTLDETKAMLSEGRTSDLIARKITEYRESLKPAMQAHARLTGVTKRRTRKWSVEGDEVCPDRMNARHMKCFRTMKRRRDAPTVRLAFQVAQSGGNSEDGFASVVAATIAVADGLMMLGYGVEIVAVMLAKPNRGGKSEPADWSYISVPLKKSSERLDVERVGSAGLPGFFRWLFWAYMYGGAEANNRFGSPAKFDYESHSCFGPSRELKDELGIAYLFENSWNRHASAKSQAMKFEGILDEVLKATTRLR